MLHLPVTGFLMIPSDLCQSSIFFYINHDLGFLSKQPIISGIQRMTQDIHFFHNFRRRIMTQIPSQPPVMSPGCGCSQSRMTSPYQASSLVQKQSVSAYESMNAGLTIKTREGDIVTLSSSSFDQIESRMYNSQGTIVTDTGRVAVSATQREITLTSGRQFTFTVQGDLSAGELEDIDSILQGIDGIMAEMVSGDMDDAIAKALSMGGYDSISEYSADLMYQRSYRMTSETEAVTSSRTLPDHPQMPGPDTSSYLKKADPAAIFEKMRQLIEENDMKLIEASRRPIDQLFDLYLQEFENDQGTGNDTYKTVKTLKEDIGQAIGNMLDRAFKDTFKQLF